MTKNQMRPIPFARLLAQCLDEYRRSRSLFSVPVEKMDSSSVSPIGPAAGPHTQMAQNIVASWAAGARHFELKTVQVLEGESLGILKPCIAANGAVFNTEWSTELTVEEARDEYVKAWFLIHILSREFGLESSGQPVFYMSVGYTLDGIKSSKVDGFIESMKDARATEIWKGCVAETLDSIGAFQNVAAKDIDSVPERVCASVTLSTMHGCPAGEIEKIARHLLVEKGLDVYLKMNPTLLGKDRVAESLRSSGFDPKRLLDDSFAHDLSHDDAAAMLRRLIDLARGVNRVFGAKLTNTLPVSSRGELSGDVLYLSGAHLFPIAVGVAAILARDFGSELPLSYSGGADRSNVSSLADAGLFPITVSSALIAPGGYKNLSYMNRAISASGWSPRTGADAERLEAIRSSSLSAMAEGKGPRFHARTATASSDPHAADQPKDECGRCSNCVDVCPNRANVPGVADGKRAVRHDSSLCNECGACACLCIEGRVPWRDKKEISREGDTAWNHSR